MERKTTPATTKWGKRLARRYAVPPKIVEQISQAETATDAAKMAIGYALQHPGEFKNYGLDRDDTFTVAPPQNL